jgi:hypothetical protein
MAGSPVREAGPRSATRSRGVPPPGGSARPILDRYKPSATHPDGRDIRGRGAECRNAPRSVGPSPTGRRFPGVPCSPTTSHGSAPTIHPHGGTERARTTPGPNAGPRRRHRARHRAAQPCEHGDGPRSPVTTTRGLCPACRPALRLTPQASVTGSSVHTSWLDSRPEVTAASAHASSGAKVSAQAPIMRSASSSP